jgi:hypothetical protein
MSFNCIAGVLYRLGRLQRHELQDTGQTYALERFKYMLQQH